MLSSLVSVYLQEGNIKVAAKSLRQQLPVSCVPLASVEPHSYQWSDTNPRLPPVVRISNTGLQLHQDWTLRRAAVDPESWLSSELVLPVNVSGNVKRFWYVHFQFALTEG
ncbi:hypothetical protein AV530_019788 [Patagioenas fasciata monilis]|uniref:Uncharacterized protein n=1 Tax=Patagioenas fasciata monilis TaxID=372326 RepID=A0A1V4K0X4_PATFA|nr:hypothetical protein AV530_019788 [Patagioenas fasciata monilis]